ncbi:hypothetical protein ACFQJ7_00680 [Halovenus rubra]|uniref:Lipoprotein n=2 Tax=Halovenus rubra TaxID=869890 RepID=A0ABD5X3X0_9EURY|nr:hypothetical protein [Halovenus rubra]
MERRAVLGSAATVALGSLAGCITSKSAGTDSEETPDPTETPKPFPDSCPEGPDVDGLPSLPESPSEENISEFVSEFERVYAVATTRYRSLEDIRVTHTESTNKRFRVQMAVEATTTTPTPDGETPTPKPADAHAYRVLYRVQGEQVIRELRDYAGGRKIDSDCWTLRSK